MKIIKPDSVLCWMFTNIVTIVDLTMIITRANKSQ